MTFLTRRNRKWIYLVISILFVLTGLFVLTENENTYETIQDDQPLPTVDENMGISMDNVHQVLTRDGRKEWILDALSARMIESKKKLLLKKLSAIYFLKNGGEIHITADEAFLNTKTNNVEIKGNVVLINDQINLTSEQMEYNHSLQLIYSPGPVKIFDGSSEIGANSMIYYLNTNKTLFLENVKGEFSGKIDF